MLSSKKTVKAPFFNIPPWAASGSSGGSVALEENCEVIMAYDLIKISALPETTPDESQDIVIGDGDYAKRIKYGDVKADMVGTSPTYTTDTEPYLMRRTAHTGVVGKCALNKLVGGSLGWNQLIQNLTSRSAIQGITRTASSDGTSMTYTGTATTTDNYTAFAFYPVIGHKYLMTLGNVSLPTGTKIVGATQDKTTSIIVNVTTSAYSLGVTINSGVVCNFTIKPMAIDLTAMFGSTIADYVYGLEQATAGAGVAWLRKYIDIETYHAYDAGSIQNVQATAHVTTGKNLLDVTNEASGSNAHIREYNLPNLPLGTYTVSAICNSTASTDCAVLFIYKDGTNTASPMLTNGSWSSQTFNLTKPVKTLRIYSSNGYNTSQSNTVVITSAQLEFGSTATAYEPYTAHTYPLGSDTLRGYPMLVNNKLAFDGDIKTPDGTTRRRYNIIDLGSLDWTYNSASGHERFVASITPQPRFIANNVAFNGVCAKYEVVSNGSVYDHAKDKIIGVNDVHQLAVYDSAYTNAATFKTAMSGTYLVYEKSAESTESGTAYQKIQTIDTDGTESFTTSSPVPVGHETQTPDNILAALGWLGE